MTLHSRTSEENHAEEGHYWISISDLMTSLLFIFIIILAYTILTFSQESEAYEENFNARSDLLNELKTVLAKRDIDVDIDPQNGNMRIRSDTFFAIGSAELSKEGVQKIGEIARQIRDKMKGKRFQKAIDTVFIEGHTDNRPFTTTGSRRWTNMELSSQRAINSFLVMDGAAELKQMKNTDGKFLFSYSGYGATRPVDMNDTVEARNKNRRIEFFFALSSPKVPQ